MKIYLLKELHEDPFGNNDYWSDNGYTTDPLTAAAWNASGAESTPTLGSSGCRFREVVELKEVKIENPGGFLKFEVITKEE